MGGVGAVETVVVVVVGLEDVGGGVFEVGVVVVFFLPSPSLLLVFLLVVLLDCIGTTEGLSFVGLLQFFRPIGDMFRPL